MSVTNNVAGGTLIITVFVSITKVSLKRLHQRVTAFLKNTWSKCVINKLFVAKSEYYVYVLCLYAVDSY